MDFLFDDRQSGGHTLHGLVDGILDELGQCWIVWGRRCFLGRLLAAFSLHFHPLVVTPVLIQLTRLVRLARTTGEAQGVRVRCSHPLCFTCRPCQPDQPCEAQGVRVRRSQEMFACLTPPLLHCGAVFLLFHVLGPLHTVEIQKSKWKTWITIKYHGGPNTSPWGTPWIHER